MFDEVKVFRTLEYDVRHDGIIGPHNQLQVIMVRGIVWAPWKQPLMMTLKKSIIFMSAIVAVAIYSC